MNPEELPGNKEDREHYQTEFQEGFIKKKIEVSP